MLMMLWYLIIAAVLALFVGLTEERSTARLFASFFYIVQLAFGVVAVTMHPGVTSSLFFTFDMLGMAFFVLMSVVSAVAFFQSNRYLDTESLHQYKIYNVSLILLCASAAAVYFANHIAVTWVFLEMTTLCTAGLVYHRRNTRSLEATWKYIFVCSTGIAMAYLGILLLGTVAREGDMSYDSLMQAVAAGNPLYLKIAFLFILVGYSCKMEIFPLYTIGVDANFAAPTPASAVISTVLVNAGFVSVFRVYKIISASPVYEWMSAVLIIAGLISVLIGAVYLRRTNNYKRFFSYSTVENMGIAAVGLGVGGVGVFAAVFHVLAHTLIKSGLFFNMAQIGKIYGTYRINRIGNYVSVNKLGSVSIILGTVSLLAFPPSALFISELMILKQIIAEGKWWLLVVLVLLLCFVTYSLCYRVMQLCFKPVGVKNRKLPPVSPVVTWSGFLLIALSVVLGIVQPPQLIHFINTIISF